jgi:hypothetical protein
VVYVVVQNTVVEFRYKKVSIVSCAIDPALDAREQIIEALNLSKTVSTPRTWESFVLQAANGTEIIGRITDFNQTFLLCSPEELTPVSTSKWDSKYLKQLNMVLIPLAMEEFFEKVFRVFNARESISAKCKELEQKLAGLNENVVSSFGDIKLAHELRTSQDPKYVLLREPLVKKLYLTRKYNNHESMVDSFVSALFDESGFNLESLCVAPQLRLSIMIGDTKVESIPDFVILDLMSFYRIAVVEDKSAAMERIDSLPQLVGEAIAIHQCNFEKEISETRLSKVPRCEPFPLPSVEDEKEEEEEEENDPIIGIRVSGARLFFYGIIVSRAVTTALRTLSPARTPTKYYVCGKEDGYNFWDSVDRKEVLQILDILKEIITSSEARNVRHYSR